MEFIIDNLTNNQMYTNITMISNYPLLTFYLSNQTLDNDLVKFYLVRLYV